MKRLAWILVALIALALIASVSVPVFVGDGSAWLIIEVTAIDETTSRSISHATATLDSAERRRYGGVQAEPPHVLVAKTTETGPARLADEFPAGFGNWTTSIRVDGSTIRCEAAGYVTAEVPVSAARKLHFRKGIFHKEPQKVRVKVPMKRLSSLDE
jgi:hypothetical protein